MACFENAWVCVYSIDTPLAVCESRAGEIKNFTGIDSAYELPVSPEVHVQTAGKSIEECAKQVVDYLKANGYLSIKVTHMANYLGRKTL